MTKQKRPATAKRKRAKGAGRPPKGPFADLTRPFSIRMPDKLRKRLEAVGKRNDQSIGQEVLRRVQYTLDRDLACTDPLAMQALCFLIARIGRDASNGSAEDNWRTDPYCSKVFQRAVAILLQWLEPAGDPKPGRRPYDSPEDEGDSIAEKVWYELHDPPDPEPVPDEVFEHILGPRGSDLQLRKLVRKILEDREYGMVNANRDLLGPALANEPSVEQAKPLAQTSELGQSDSAQPEPNRMGILGTLGEPFSSRAARKESNT